MEFVDILCQPNLASHMLGLDRDDDDDVVDDDDDEDEEIDFDDEGTDGTGTDAGESLFSGSGSDLDTQTYDYAYGYSADESATETHSMPFSSRSGGSRSRSRSRDAGAVRHIHPRHGGKGGSGISHHTEDPSDDVVSTFQKTTRLFDAIDNSYWSSVETFLTTGKWAQGGRTMIPPVPLREEAQHWNVTLNKFGKVIHRRLPIHAALENGAPLVIVRLLVELYPAGTSCADSQGNLPLHLGFMYDAAPNVLQYLLEAYPEAVLVKNHPSDHLRPTTLASSSKSRKHDSHSFSSGGLYPMECRGVMDTAADGSSSPRRSREKKRKAIIQQCRDRARQFSLQELDETFGESSNVPTTSSLVHGDEVKASDGNDSDGQSDSHSDKDATTDSANDDLMEIKKELEELRKNRSQGTSTRTAESSAAKNTGSNKTTKDSNGDDVFTMTPNGWVWTTFLDKLGGSSESQSRSVSSSPSGDTDNKNPRLPAIAEVLSNETDNNTEHEAIKSVTSFGDRLKQSLSTKFAGASKRNSEQRQYEDDQTAGESVEVNLNDPTSSNVAAANSKSSTKKKFMLPKLFRKTRKAREGTSNNHQDDNNSIILDHVTVSSSVAQPEPRSLLSRLTLGGAVNYDSNNAIGGSSASSAPGSGNATADKPSPDSNDTVPHNRSLKGRLFPKHATEWWQQHSRSRSGDETAFKRHMSHDSSASEAIHFSSDVDEARNRTSAAVGKGEDKGGVFSNAFNYEATSMARAMSDMIHTREVIGEECTEQMGNEKETSGMTTWRKKISMRKSATDEKKTTDAFSQSEDSKVLKGNNQHSFLENAFLLASGKNRSEPGQAIGHSSSTEKEEAHKGKSQTSSRALDRVFSKGRRSKHSKSSRKIEEQNLSSSDDNDHTESYHDDDEESYTGQSHTNEEDYDDDYESTSNETHSGTNSVSSVSYVSDGLGRIKETRSNTSKKEDASWICAPQGSLAAVLSEASFPGAPVIQEMGEEQAGLPKVEEHGPKSKNGKKGKSSIGGFFRRKISRDRSAAKSVKSSEAGKLKLSPKSADKEETTATSATDSPTRSPGGHSRNLSHLSLPSNSSPRPTAHARHPSLSSYDGAIAKSVLPPKGDWRAEYEEYISSNNSTGTKSSKRSSKRSFGRSRSPGSKKKTSGFFGKIKKSRDRLKDKKSLKKEQGRQEDSEEDRDRLLVSEPLAREPSGMEILQDLETVSPFPSHHHRSRSPSYQKPISLESAVYHSRSSDFQKLGMPSLEKDGSTQSTGPVVSESTVEANDEGNVYLVRVQF